MSESDPAVKVVIRKKRSLRVRSSLAKKERFVWNGQGRGFFNSGRTVHIAALCAPQLTHLGSCLVIERGEVVAVYIPPVGPKPIHQVTHPIPNPTTFPEPPPTQHDYRHLSLRRGQVQLLC